MRPPISLIVAVLLGSFVLPAIAAEGGTSLPALPESPSTMPVLLGLEPVRRDLKVSSLQEALLDSLRAEYKAKVGVVAAAGLADPKIAPKCENEIKLMRVRYNQRTLRILNPSQQQRLREIERQMLGAYFLNSPSEQDHLGFTPRQKKQAADIVAYDRKKSSSIMKSFHDGKISSFRKDIELHRLQTTVGRSMLHLLTPSQREHYLGLSGPKMKM